MAWPWNLALDCCLNQNMISLSVSLSLILLFPPSLSQIMLNQDYLLWSWMKYLTQENCPSLYQIFFTPSSDAHQKYKKWSRKNTSVGIETFQIRQSFPHSSIVSPSLLPPDHIMCTVIYVVPNLTQRSKHFQPCSHEGSRKNKLSCSRTHLHDQLLWISWGGGHLDSCLGDWGNEVCDSSYLTELASEHGLSTLYQWPGWQWPRLKDIHHPKPVSILNILHPYLHLWL